ncbi:uncharacterized protein LOC108903956 [Anoplophora glabripennis]|uniref:uncharacterized protein LOC108903956 n=1 Tax=Anoplophora glabripennis TaxID=217634 RepID=UPI000874329B|nr:uncharacterized protein LOC108903956 [Anoplophora glabripennis]
MDYAGVLILLTIFVFADGAAVVEAKSRDEHVSDDATPVVEVNLRGAEIVELGRRVENTRNCTCMNWRSCHGDINSDVDCFQSYLQVCCVLPDPHNATPHKAEGDAGRDNIVEEYNPHEEIKVIYA